MKAPPAVAEPVLPDVGPNSSFTDVIVTAARDRQIPLLPAGAGAAQRAAGLQRAVAEQGRHGRPVPLARGSSQDDSAGTRLE